MAALLGSTLDVPAEEAYGSSPPTHDMSPLSRRRGVWWPRGWLSKPLGFGYVDALALLRSRAFLDGRSVDDHAGDLVTGVLNPVQLRL